MRHIHDWYDELKGKTLTNIKTRYEGENFIPCVEISFAGGFNYEIHTLKNVYFEGCYINTLRRARPITSVVIEELEERMVLVEVQTNSFALFQVRARYGAGYDLEEDDFPFVLFQVGD